METNPSSRTNNRFNPERVRRRVQESKSGLFVLMLIGRFMVEMAASKERDPVMRQVKRQQLLGQWTMYSSNIAARA